uniref:Uncharacterized protein n=1 Tax=Tetraodon nigroviridis TaxID=99883 RepID=H3C660_TETNG
RGRTSTQLTGLSDVKVSGAISFFYLTLCRKHVDALLDISEEELLKELEPQEDHCYGGWDEAVRGWTRAAPLSCILATQKDCKKPKQKESADLLFSNTEASATVNTPDQLNQQAGSQWHGGGAGPLRRRASRWPSGREKSPPPRPREGDTQDLRQAPVEIRPTRLQKPSHTSNTAVPIKHFTFLPPIASPQRRPQMLGGRATALGGKSTEERALVFVPKSRTRGTTVGAVNPGAPAGVCHHSLRLFSAIGASAQNSSVTAGASGCTAANRSSLSSGKRVVHSGGAAPRIPAMNPSKAVCAVNL